MTEVEQKLRDLIEESNSILITSHISPDGDSVSSSLLLYSILRLNYPDKKVVVSMEEKPFGLEFLEGYQEIKFQPLEQSLQELAPSLIIILDANALHRITRNPDSVQDQIIKNTVIVIDHHEGSWAPSPAIYINNSSSSVTFDIYQIFLEQMAMKKPDGYAQTALTGIYTDTGGFMHPSSNLNEIFRVVPKLLNDGANIETIANHLSQISQGALQIVGELLTNTRFDDDFTYSFISDENATPDNHEALVQGADVYRNQFIRSVKGHPWGFIVYRDVLAPSKTYSVSFRAPTDGKDVSKIAVTLGGGGHKPAAGAKFRATDVKDALNKVLRAIEQNAAS